MTSKSPRRKPTFPGSLTDLHRFRKTVHGHDGSSRIVMVRKTDQRTYASIQNGKEPKLETITRETIETFRGQRTACKITTERKGCEEKVPADLIESLTDRSRKSTPVRLRSVKVRNNMDFQTECLKAHNEYRKKHGVSLLKLNKEMCNVSQDFANYLVRKSNLEHSNNNKYGENIYCITSSDKSIMVKGDEPVKQWYNEISKHDFHREPSSLSTGHFTQVVWKETKELGVAYAKSNGKVVVVANYYPPGNVIGQFVKNVPPLVNYESQTLEKLSNITITPKKKNTNSCVSNNFKQECLESHNKYRKQHGVPLLKLDEDLCKYSEEWAKMCADRNILEHRKNNPYGENIYCIFSTDPNLILSGNTPVDSWYDEIKQHIFGKEPNNLKSGHFTQVVWKTSEKLGVGVARRNNHFYVVANYSPAGNFVGHFAENVLPLGSVPCQIEEKTYTSHDKSDPNYNIYNQFELEALKAHNEYRRKHGVPDLKLNRHLCDYAKEWAQQCSVSGMNHRSRNEYGENIYMSYSSDFSFTPTAKEAVSTWYNEIRDYSFGIEYVNAKALHFTQVVWKGSTEMGIGLAKNNRGETFIVANYNPRGNYVGQFTTNVLKPKV